MPPAISAVVVLYHPLTNVSENILSYASLVEHVYVVDNTEKPDPDLVRAIKQIPHAEYLDNHGNQGIAHALNRGAQAALATNSEWLLTMDQDSRATPGCLKTLVEYIQEHPNEPLGIVSAFQLMGDQLPPDQPVIEPLTVITSGNLLNLAAYQTTGPFEDKLFIDYVDHEYDLRLRQYGYQIVQVTKALLEHKLGDYSQSKIGSKTYGYTNHAALRRYYITRNRLYVMQLYRKDFPQFYQRERAEFWRELAKIILFEQHKRAKLRAIWLGFRDYQKGQYGIKALSR